MPNNWGRIAFLRPTKLVRMQAMVFAAGLGTRLRPLTNDRPKALVEVGGKSLLEWNLRKLERQGFKRVVLNVHHFADRVAAFLRGQSFDLAIQVSDERDVLLDTGGGLAKARSLFETGPILVHNVDILSDLDLAAFHQLGQTSDATALLAVRRRTSSRYLLFDSDQHLAGWRNVRTQEKRLVRPGRDLTDLAFSGIYLLKPQIFDYFPPNKQVFSIIDVLLAAAAHEPLLAFDHTNGAWLDVGKPEALAVAEQFVAHGY